nr:PREDICTED: putative ATP-dependent RNA helicase TDRD12 [Paralichthys olivaceus]
MFKISILKVENPSCLWGRVFRSLGTNTETTEEYDSMLSQMNLFYHDVTKDLFKLKPTSIEEGQVCVVYWSVRRLWCRAVVESIITDSVSCKARCLLVDHGERLVVASDQIRVAAQNFLQLPFWVRRFHLAGIKPTTLRVCVYQENAELIPTTHWDSSATLYLHNLLHASTWTEAVMLESDSDSTSIELYLTVGNIKICVNDDLVAKKFAYYTRESAETSGLDEVDRFPIMLSSSILTQTASITSRKPTKKIKPPAVTSECLAAGRACDWLTAPSPPQSQQHELSTSDGDCRPNITEEQLSPGSQSGSSSQPAAVESDSPDDTDSSLAAALTRNLSLFKFMKFLNPGSSHQQEAHSVGELEELNNCQPKELTTASTTCTGQEELTPLRNSEPVTPDEDVVHMSCKSISVESGPAETEKTRRSEAARACSRLLEWLNPEPLNPDPDAGDDTVVPSEPRTSGILVHSALPVQPCTNLDDAPITDALRWVLRQKQYSTLSPADCYSWPAVSRGCNTVIVSPNADQPLSYLAPLLTHILLNSIFSSLTSSMGPIAVLLCPGWEKVQQVYDLLENFKITHVLHPVVMLMGVGKDEAKTIRIPKNCLLLVTTPFSFVRLLSCHCFMFLRLYHLLLDEADQLFTLAPDEMEIILQHFQKVTSSEEKNSSPQQLIAVAKRWTSHMEGLLTNHMPYPCIVMTAPEEAALYGNVQQVILMTLESSKISELLGTLDFSPDVGQKTLIIANCAQEVEDVFKAVSSKSAFCLKAHERVTHQFDFVIQQWRKNIGPGTHVILVTTNECLKCFGIRDASCVIHYGFPTSPKLFGSRLFSMSDNFRNLSERVSTQDQTGSCPHVTRSVLLISERNARHVVGVLRYLGRTNALLPPELLSFSQGIYMVREDLKTNRPLCSYLKSLGVTRAISQKIRGLQHRARAVLSLGNTVFVDPMVRVSQVPGMKTVINEYNVQSEILNTGMGISNPDHLKLLRALCQEGEDSSSKEAGHTNGVEDNSVSLEVRIKAEEEVLAEVFRAAEARKLSDPPQLEPLSPVSPMSHSPVPAPPASQLHLSDIQAADEQRYNHTPDLKSAKQMMSFHPQILWYQTSDSMIVTVKLMNPESQHCDFYPDRVIYSGRVNSKSYRADLELQGNIAVDRCCWEMKYNEPVLKLVKQQQGHWEKLLRNKNIFVSYDMQHFEDNEDKAPNGPWFVGNTGEDNWYVNSESSSESD